MHALAIIRDFSAWHYLIGGDWGPENDLHTHDYRLELELSGKQLGPHGFLIDLVDLNTTVDSVLGDYADRILNDAPGFEGLNPSIEHLARILCERFGDTLDSPNVGRISARVWEDRLAWASFERSRP